MHFNSTTFRIDPTPRRADDGYLAHARISCREADGSEREIHTSGDLVGFDVRDDAVAYARHWAMEWLDARYD
ncbi:MAG: hypothetical protein QOI13_2358 [Paraburkholderia sp.]|nr:hypothetical protein [Paraburkholderia sp.]